jgi:uncharacterized lipoprotein YehR (DUF1307 family)
VGGAIASGSSSLGGSAKITLDNLSNSTPVSVESVAVCYANLGGIIGRTDLTDATASLTSSVNYGEINLKDTSTSTGTISMYAGGLIGRGDNITVKAGANRDNVTVSTDHLIAYAGGIVGLMEKGGTIDNNSNIGNISAISGADTARSGGIAGHMEGGSSVANSHNSGRVIANSTYNWAWSGGIVGVMNGGDIDNDNNTGAVTATSTSNYAYSGGIVGQVFLSATLGATSATIDNSSNTGAVRTESKTAYSGGIAGELKANDGTVVAGIENNSNTGKVEADASDGYAYSGGIAGRVTLSSIYAAATATIDNCSNTGSDNISASVSSGTGFYASSGGIVGYMEGGGSIRNSHNSDNVTANISGGYGSAYSGGLVGYSSSSIANSYATGDVKAIATADSYAGGLVGKMHSGSSITNSYATGATGDVTANSPSTYAGGLVGDMYSGSSITNSYATGDVKAIATADSYAGGLVGRTLGSITSSVAANRKVEMTQATPYNMGRIAGLDVSGTASNSLALNTMEAIYNDTPNSSNGENGITKTDAELKDQYTYENDLGWEFGDSGDPIWKMPNGGGYPILYWQKQ